MIKKYEVLSRSFHKCLPPINMLAVEGGSETSISREWYNLVFDSLYFQKYVSYHDHFFSKIFEIWWSLDKRNNN